MKITTKAILHLAITTTLSGAVDQQIECPIKTPEDFFKVTRFSKNESPHFKFNQPYTFPDGRIMVLNSVSSLGVDGKPTGLTPNYVYVDRKKEPIAQFASINMQEIQIALARIMSDTNSGKIPGMIHVLRTTNSQCIFEYILPRGIFFPESIEYRYQFSLIPATPESITQAKEAEEKAKYKADEENKERVKRDEYNKKSAEVLQALDTDNFRHWLDAHIEDSQWFNFLPDFLYDIERIGQTLSQTQENNIVLLNRTLTHKKGLKTLEEKAEDILKLSHEDFSDFLKLNLKTPDRILYLIEICSVQDFPQIKTALIDALSKESTGNIQTIWRGLRNKESKFASSFISMLLGSDNGKKKLAELYNTIQSWGFTSRVDLANRDLLMEANDSIPTPESIAKAQEAKMYIEVSQKLEADNFRSWLDAHIENTQWFNLLNKLLIKIEQNGNGLSEKKENNIVLLSRALKKKAGLKILDDEVVDILNLPPEKFSIFLKSALTNSDGILYLIEICSVQDFPQIKTALIDALSKESTGSIQTIWRGLCNKKSKFTSFFISMLLSSDNGKKQLIKLYEELGPWAVVNSPVNAINFSLLEKEYESLLLQQAAPSSSSRGFPMEKSSQSFRPFGPTQPKVLEEQTTEDSDLENAIRRSIASAKVEEDERTGRQNEFHHAMQESLQASQQAKEYKNGENYANAELVIGKYSKKVPGVPQGKIPPFEDIWLIIPESERNFSKKTADIAYGVMFKGYTIPHFD